MLRFAVAALTALTLSAPAFAEVTTNALTNNAITVNAITVNALTNNALTNNALTNNGVKWSSHAGAGSILDVIALKRRVETAEGAGQ